LREPRISGAVLANETTLTLPAALPEAKAARTLPPVNPRFDMVLIIGRNSWLTNPSMRLQLDGRIPIRGTLSEPQVRGTLIVERGTLTFPTARFRVTGEIDVVYAPALQGELVAPLRVDLVATTRVRGRDPSTGRSQQYEITLIARGPLAPIQREQAAGQFGEEGGLQPPRFGQLQIQATSDPPLPQSQILALIGRGEALEGILAGGGNVQDVLRQEFEQALTTSVVPALFLPFETAVEGVLGLDEFAIDIAFREPVQLRLGKDLVGGLGASYSRSLTGAQTQEQYDLYYRISRRLRFGYRIEEPFHLRSWFLNGAFRF
jgi:hypothetical protein